jgi:hypothetical protein
MERRNPGISARKHVKKERWNKGNMNKTNIERRKNGINGLAWCDDLASICGDGDRVMRGAAKGRPAGRWTHLSQV